ncbi:glycosyltransferase family 2 protein [Veillonella parvula]|jgi:GT2 family glycosyltransferase|uniref:glycosyltransferase family 2 protein n=1 Tax=Veillonella parvula TaxID=29466 RepID=UPI001C8C5A46|nr:glycosyltransferase family 2 protein [Veillonella parvula]MBX8924534.1 glycosyltransferase [Veillonella parvula]
MRTVNTIVAVVVTYNRKDLLRKCLKALLAQRDYSCDIIVVNNASIDGTKEFLDTYLNEHCITIHHLDNNLGGAGGFNYGMREAVLSGYEYIWLMDDDCICNVDTLSALMHADSVLKGEYGWIASRVEWIDGSLCIMNIPKPLKKQIYPIQELDQASFVSILFKTNVIKKVGLPISEFFIWGDDVEYTRRITKRFGMKSYWIRDSVVTHEMAINKGSNIAIDVIERLPRYELAFRNEFYLYSKEGFYGYLYYHLKVAFNALKILVKAKDNRVKRLKSLWKGYRDGIRFNPDIEYIKEV